MGDIADFTNIQGIEGACHDQDIIDRGDRAEMFEAGLIDNQGFMDMSNPPGLIGFSGYHKPLFPGVDCPQCSGTLVQRTNRKLKINFLGCSRFPKCRFNR